MPFAVHWMTRDIWQLVTSQGTECTDDEYRLAEKIVTRIGPAYEWPRRALASRHSGVDGTAPRPHSRAFIACRRR